MSRPTDLAGLPDGRLVLLSQNGPVNVLPAGGSVPTLALDLATRICSDSERGVLGVAVDPAFSTNQRLFLYYTLRRGSGCPEAEEGGTPPVNRVSSFVLGSGNLIDPASEVLLLDGIASLGVHNGGALVIRDGLLFVSVGDARCRINEQARCGVDNDNSQNLSVLNGKILRVGLDGSVPSGNPFAGTPGAHRCAAPSGPQPGTGPCSEVWASGLRNPFRIVSRPGDLLIHDVGEQTWEEINVGAAGANYGWNRREGPCDVVRSTGCSPTPAGLTDPYFAYTQGDDCGSITGGAVAPTAWPAPYGGAYLFLDFVCGKMFRLVEGSGPPSGSTFSDAVGLAVAMKTTPLPGGEEAVFYTTYSGGGELHRIRYTTSPPPPPGAPSVTLSKDGAGRLRISWTAVTGASEYLWTVRTCGGTLVKANETRDLTKTVSPVANGCYRGFVRVDKPAAGPSARAHRSR